MSATARHPSPLRRFTAEWLDGNFTGSSPIVWRLRLPQRAFRELEEALRAVTDHAKRLAEPAALVVYLAEWYRRKYLPGTQVPSERLYAPTTQELRELVEAAGIDPERWIARTPVSGNRTWLYSLYVLGGLPIKQLLAQGSTQQRLLRKICRIYQNPVGATQEEELIDDDDTTRSAAFRAALQGDGALHAFLKEILIGNSPFAEEDTKDPSSPESTFLKRLRQVNAELLREKFRPEWRLTALPENNAFTRQLRLWPLPETDGENHAYLSYERLRAWGFEEPETPRLLSLAIRFQNAAGEPLSEVRDLAYYANLRNGLGVFLSRSIDERIPATISDNELPADLATAELIVCADTGEEHLAQRIAWEPPMQFRQTTTYGIWSTEGGTQRRTAVLWHAPWKPVTPPEEACDLVKFFRNIPSNDVLPWHLTRVPERLTLHTDDGKEKTYFHRQGHDTLQANLHTEILRYDEAGKVRYTPADPDDDDEGDDEEERLPLLFEKDDLRLLRTDDDGVPHDAPIETLEWMDGTRYRPWDEENKPPSGKCRIRATARGRQFVGEFLLLSERIIRDLDHNLLRFPGGEWRDPSANALPDGTSDPAPICPIKSLEIRLAAGGSARIDVWRPIHCREILKDGRVLLRTVRESLRLPAAIAEDTYVNILGENGFRQYNCTPLFAFYRQEMDQKRKLLTEVSALPATSFDSFAPTELELTLGRDPMTAPKETKFLQWDYASEPFEVSRPEDGSKLPSNAILLPIPFQGENPALRFHACVGPVNPFQMVNIRKCPLLTCFLRAADTATCYFAFHPLWKRLTSVEILQREILEPLRRERGGELTEKDRRELHRLCREFALDESLMHPEN